MGSESIVTTWSGYPFGGGSGWRRGTGRWRRQLAGALRLAGRRGGRARFVMRNGRGAALDPSDPLGGEEFVAVASIDDRQPESKIFLAAPITREEIDQHFARHVVAEQDITWDERTEAVVARRRLRLGAIVLEEAAVRDR